MDTLTWKKFFEVVAFVVVFAVPVILYLMEKAGISLVWIFMVGWLSIGAAALYLVLSIPWVWENAPMAVRVWRISLVSAVALLAVGYGAIKIWPYAPTGAAEVGKESKPIEKLESNSQPHEAVEKNANSPTKYSSRTEVSRPRIQLPPAGFVTFVGQILNGRAPMMQANQTDVPLDDVHLSVTQSILKSASDPGPWQVGWQKEIEIGTCRAKLTLGLPEQFPVGDYNWMRFDIFMLTRLQTYREIISLTKENQKEYKAELSFYNGADVKPSYKQTMKLSVVNFPDSSGKLKQPVKQRALLLANRIQPFYNEQAESGRSLHMISPPQTKEDADANTKTENDFHRKVVSLFHEQFGGELEEIISEMQKPGLDVSDIRQKSDAHDYWMIPYIVKDLHDLASQIDDQGNLVH